MGSRLSGLGSALWDSKRREFLGRDGAGWGKLGVFYFFFYLGLAGFFCAMLAVFMALSPRDRPRYYLESSRMKTRSNPLSPGLGFRPQPDVVKNLIFVDKDPTNSNKSLYVESLDQYLDVYYWQKDKAPEKESAEDKDESGEEKQIEQKKFKINNPGECTSTYQYGFPTGRPCVLVKMNKIVGFIPRPGTTPHDKAVFQATGCQNKPNVTPVHCYGEYPADVDNIGRIRYISQNDDSDKCGGLGAEWFPYDGKTNRKDYYQAPYVWVQFTNPKPNVLINVICRVYGQNIDFDKKTGRALTRFQIYVNALPEKSASSRKAGEV